MGTISGLIDPLYYFTTCALVAFKIELKNLNEFNDKTILLMSIQIIFGLNKFLAPLPGTG